MDIVLVAVTSCSFNDDFVLHVKPGEEQQAGSSQKMTMEAREMELASGSPCYVMNYDESSLHLLLPSM